VPGQSKKKLFAIVLTMYVQVAATMLIAIQILTQMFGKNKHEAVASYPEV
jgi:hypothetical protein